MKTFQKIAGVVLALLLIAVAYGIFHTRTTVPPVPTNSAATEAGAKTPSGQAQIVDQTPLKIAQQLAPLVTLAGGRQLAGEPIRLTDHEVVIAFPAALRDAALHPPPLSAEAMEIQARMQKAEHGLAASQAQIAQLNAAIAKAAGDQKDSLEDQLDIANAQVELDQDEVDDAKQDLIRAGGDPQDRIQAIVKEHEASTKATETALAAAATPSERIGLVYRSMQWWELHKKQMLLWRADAATANTIGERWGW